MTATESTALKRYCFRYWLFDALLFNSGINSKKGEQFYQDVAALADGEEYEEMLRAIRDICGSIEVGMLSLVSVQEHQETTNLCVQLLPAGTFAWWDKPNGPAVNLEELAESRAVMHGLSAESARVFAKAFISFVGKPEFQLYGFHKLEPTAGQNPSVQRFRALPIVEERILAVIEQ